MSELLAQARDALVAAGVTGPHRSHSRGNAISKITAVLEGEGDDDFGLTGFEKYSASEILGFVAELTGCSSDIAMTDGYDEIDPDLTIAGMVAAARRLRAEASRGSSLLAATGHPTGMLEFYIRIVDAYRRAGGKVLRLREEETLTSNQGRHFEFRYVGNVGCLADWGSLQHTHSARAMESLLEGGPWPDIVLGDHGYAGGAIARGIPTIAIMDVNDPALAVAWAERNDVVIVPLDDNRVPHAYEPATSIFEIVLSGEDL
jgi:hypothetical protein